MKTFTKYFLLTSFLFNISFTAFTQNQGTKNTKPTRKIGTPEYLLVKRGFKIFKLGTPIEQYRKYVSFINEDEDSKLYRVLSYYQKTEFASIGGSIEINDILFIVHDGLIVSISVFTEPKYKEALLRSLKAAYGPGEKENQYIEEYNWHASGKKSDISLTYRDSYEGGGRTHGNAWAMFQDNKLIDKLDKEVENKAKQTVGDL